MATANVRIEIAQPDIVAMFDDLPKKVLTRSEIDDIFATNKAGWRLAASMSVKAFIEYLKAQTKLEEVVFDFPSRKEVRYIWGEASVYDVVLSLKPRSYLTHYTAMFLNNLTEQIPKTIYLNQEQPTQHQRAADLEQERIDAAFSRRVRVSNDIAPYKDFQIRIVHGQQTGRLGVVEMKGAEDETISVTNVERTLIDISVRPVYSGGVFEVLKAYKLAKDNVSVNRLVAILKKMNYAYPYHQVIGFYLERAGYKASSIQLLRKIPKDLDFYLEHGIAEKGYSKEWRLFFPKGF